MVLAALLFAIGALLLHALPALPDFSWAWVLPACLVAALRWSWARWCAVAVAGFAWAWWHAGAELADRLAPHLQGRDLVVTGRIASVPDERAGRVRFVLAADPGQSLPRRIRLGWYGWYDDTTGAQPRAAERWRLTVRLRRPRGLSNPGSFDYEGWLFRQGIGATGYVLQRGVAERLDDGHGHYPILRLRAGLNRRIATALGHEETRGIIAGLAVGLRGAITPHQWQVFAASGTSHLMAISGLHIALVASLAFGALRYLWGLVPGLSRRVAACDAGCVAAALAAIGYATLAGFSVPTQRALVMSAIVLGALWRRRCLSPGRALALALAAVLLMDPLAPLSRGFWLSFTAVGVILWGTWGRLGARGRLRRFLRVQAVVFIGLVPLTLAGGQVSLVAPVVNLVMIPLFGLVVIPAVLVGVVLAGVTPAGAQAAWQLAARVVEAVWPPLEAAAMAGSVPGLVMAPPLWTVLLASLAVLLLTAPRGLPGRWTGAVLLLPLLGWRPAAPEPGGFHLALLDVGQGLAAVVQTRSHVLVYDTGPSFASGANAGDLVVLPFLRHRGHQRVDRLVLSHHDTDHRGGARAVLEAYPGTKVLASSPGEFPDWHAEPCRAGTRWRWDGVEFEILHPDVGREWGRNDGSCVLRVVGAGGSLLLTGDIEAPAEAVLLQGGVPLAADIVVVPHHGSSTSSSAGFIAATNPVHALVAAGHDNRWGFPRPEVLARWRRHGAQVFTTGEAGAIHIDCPPWGLRPPVRYRNLARHYWTAD